MLETVPHALWPALLGQIGEGVQRGCIDIEALAHLCRATAHTSPSHLSWLRGLEPWSQERLAGVEDAKASVCLVPAGAGGIGSPERSAAPTSESAQLLLPFLEETPNVETSTCLIETPSGMPDITAVAIAMAVQAILCPNGRASPLEVHAALSDDACETLGKTCGRAIVGLMAEMGCAGRPWHLVVGSRATQTKLSPYVRDLGEALRRWGDATGRLIPSGGTESDGAQAPHAAVLDALADAFIATDAGLAQERATAERTVGITQAQVHGIGVALIDLSRAVPELWDARLPRENPWATGDGLGAPLLLQIDTAGRGGDERVQAALVARLCLAAGVTLQSMVVCREGHLSEAGRSHLQASSVAHTAYGHSFPCDGAQGGDIACVDALPYGLDDTAADAPPTPRQDDEPLDAAATISGSGVLWARLLRLKHRGVLHQRVPLSLHVVARDDLMGPDAVAIALLQHLLAPPPDPVSQPDPSDRAERAAATLRRGRGLRV